MRRILLLLFLLMCCFLVLSCSSKTVPTMPEVKYDYEPDSIQLHLKADRRLNLFQNNSHSLSLCVYQLTDPNGFNLRIGEEEGLYELLECKRFDSSVATFKRLVIQPGEEVERKMDRGEGAKYVAVVAGYFTLQRDRIYLLREVPVVIEKKGWFFRTKIHKPGVMNIDLLLGPQEIHEIGGEK